MQPRMNEVRRMEERPLGELLADLVNETTTLVKNEVALAKVELTQKATKVGTNIGSLLIGGAIGYAALLGIGAAEILLVDRAMPAWVAALIVGVHVGVDGKVVDETALAKRGMVDLELQQFVDAGGFAVQ